MLSPTSPKNSVTAKITEELGYSQAPVVLYEKDGSEDHWSGLNPTKIAQVIALDTVP